MNIFLCIVGWAFIPAAIALNSMYVLGMGMGLFVASLICSGHLIWKDVRA